MLQWRCWSGRPTTRYILTAEGVTCRTDTLRSSRVWRGGCTLTKTNKRLRVFYTRHSYILRTRHECSNMIRIRYSIPGTSTNCQQKARKKRILVRTTAEFTAAAAAAALLCCSKRDAGSKLLKIPPAKKSYVPVWNLSSREIFGKDDTSMIHAFSAIVGQG